MRRKRYSLCEAVYNPLFIRRFINENVDDEDVEEEDNDVYKIENKFIKSFDIKLNDKLELNLKPDVLEKIYDAAGSVLQDFSDRAGAYNLNDVTKFEKTFASELQEELGLDSKFHAAFNTLIPSIKIKDVGDIKNLEISFYNKTNNANNDEVGVLFKGSF